jgi:hypothetical protein
VNIAQIAGRLRGKIVQFSGKLSSGLPKVMRRFVAEAMYGIAAKGSVRLSEIARALEEPIAMKKTVNRLSSRLGYGALGDHLTDRIIDDASARIQNNTLLIIDPSEVTKKYAKKMQYLDMVRDGSEGGLSSGYWTCDGVAAEAGEPDIIPLYHELYSTVAPDFISENAQILRCIERISKQVDNRGIYVMDRGGDRGTILNPLLDNERQFLIRLVGTRHLLYRGRAVEARRLAESCPLPYAERLVKEKKGKEKHYLLELGFRRVQLPHRAERLYLVVVKGFGEEPLMLLTTVEMRKKRSILWWALEAYLTRWRVEDTIRYIKQCYNLEDIRVMTYERLRNMAALVLATAYFTAVHLGLRSKLEILAGHALRAAKRIFGIPNFRYYALADGIKDILSRSRRGLDLKATRAQPQLQLPLLL